MALAEADIAYPERRIAEPLKFDIESVSFKADPLPTFAAMRAAGPVLPIRISLLGKVWVPTTHAATLALVKDNELFVQEPKHAGKSRLAGLQWWMPRSLQLMANNMLMKDEPDHRRLRRLVDRAFARRDVLAMRPAVERIADSILDGFEGRAEVDLASEFSRALPMAVICDLLGLPEADRPKFSAWTRRALEIKNALSLLKVTRVFERMVVYIRGQIEEARVDHRPGLIGELVRDEDGEKLDETELVAMILLLLVAGFETTTHLISDSVLLLETHPEAKAWLFADPAARMERAVEELARFATPVQLTKPRFVAHDAVFFGQKLKRGDIAMALLAAANADPAAFEAPETLRLDRFPNPHLVFSSGIHFCLGMQLARVEAQSALARLYARFPDLSLAAPDGIEWTARLGVRGVNTLPVTLA
ncbi:MAG: cytochrome P450 [Caulobacteraceae bacterium]